MSVGKALTPMKPMACLHTCSRKMRVDRYATENAGDAIGAYVLGPEQSRTNLGSKIANLGTHDLGIHFQHGKRGITEMPSAGFGKFCPWIFSFDLIAHWA